MKKNASTLSSDEDYAAKLFLEELVNLDSIKLSISLLKKNILIRLATSAREGTELDKLSLRRPLPIQRTGIPKLPSLFKAMAGSMRWRISMCLPMFDILNTF